MLGPVDFVVIGFNGNSFDGSIMEEISKAAEQGIIRVLDMLFIVKDEEGNILEGEFADQSEELKSSFGDFPHEEDLPLLTRSDIAKIGEQMDTETAVAVLLVEHVWARGLKESIAEAGGFLIANERLMPEIIETSVQTLESAKS